MDQLHVIIWVWYIISLASNSCLNKTWPTKMLTCLWTISFHRKALHVVIEIFPCWVRHVIMLVVYLLHLHYPAAAQMDALRVSMKSSMSSRRLFSSQLPVEDFCVCLLFRCWLLECLFSWDIRSCNNYLILSLHFTLCFGIHWVDACV
jgi:hypothetical protein